MREIKFRAYWNHWFRKTDTEDKKMIIDWQDSRECEDVGLDWLEYYDIMQYTGLKDKNDTWTDIYYDDIVYIAWYGNLHIKEMSDIITLYEASYEWDIWEIIWNIHENPNLITE